MERIAAAEEKDPKAWVPQADLALALDLSPPSLAQIVHRLRKAGLLSGQRGPSGGVGLARSAKRITVSEVVRAMDGGGIAGRCVLGFEPCSDDAPCPAHPVWSVVRPVLERELEHKSLFDLVRAVEGKKKLKTRRAPKSPPR